MGSVDSVYDLYRNNPVVWVEDELTRAVLVTAWGPARIAVAVAGSKDGVRALVRGAPPHRSARILGFVDLDFDLLNRDRWGDASCRIFCSVGHECENDLLDFDVLAAVSTRGATPSDLEVVARARATQLIAWMACKATLREVKERAQGDFPTDPALERVPDLDAAERHIVASKAWTTAPAAWSEWVAADRVRRALEGWEAIYRDALATDAWRSAFSGKELLRHLRGQNQFGLESPAPKGSSQMMRDLDLAKRIARRMVEDGRVPRPLLDLRDIILTRGT